jgi:hypothetical protein
MLSEPLVKFVNIKHVKLYLSKLVNLHCWGLEITCTLHIKMIRVYKVGAALIMHYMIHVLFLFCSIILAGVTLTQANLPGLGGRSLKLMLKLKAC